MERSRKRSEEDLDVELLAKSSSAERLHNDINAEFGKRTRSRAHASPARTCDAVAAKCSAVTVISSETIERSTNRLDMAFNDLRTSA